MEIKEVIKIEDPTNPGRLISVHFTEEELVNVVQAGLFYLIREGFIKFNSVPEVLENMPENATQQ